MIIQPVSSSHYKRIVKDGSKYSTILILVPISFNELLLTREDLRLFICRRSNITSFCDALLRKIIIPAGRKLLASKPQKWNSGSVSNGCKILTCILAKWKMTFIKFVGFLKPDLQVDEFVANGLLEQVHRIRICRNEATVSKWKRWSMCHHGIVFSYLWVFKSIFTILYINYTGWGTVNWSIQWVPWLRESSQNRSFPIL